MSTTATTRHQLDLPGQAHVAPGPLDMTGMYGMHYAFRRDLADFVAAVRHTPVGEHEVWAALQERWARFFGVLHHHHEAEDEHIWPVTRAHALEAGRSGAVAVLDSMEADHDRIDPALQACTDALAAMAQHPCTDHRNALDVEVTEVRELLVAHLAREEREAIPLIQELMSPEEWAASEKAIEKEYGLRVVPFVVPWVFKGLPADKAAEVMPLLELPHRVLLRLLTPRFLRREAVAFRYAG
jgi:iron-sulfur cluster repair protein YtfE (RIC family)